MLSLILRRLPAGRRHGRAADRRRPRAAARARSRTVGASRQATSWSTEPATGSSFGSTRLCASRTYGQRGWNAQPGGRMISEGGRPSIGTSSSSRGVSSRGIERRSPHVYGCCGAAKSSAVGARSTTRPAYMTAMSCVISATTPRSWVIMITAVPGLLLEALDQLEDLRLHGHVERGRRLVGDQQPRLVDQRHGDHRALAHAARELVRVGAEPVAGVRDAHQGEHLRRARAARLLGDVVVRLDGLHELVADLVERMQRGERVLEDHRDLLAAHLAQLGVVHRQQVAPLEQHLAAERRVAGAGEPEHGEVRDALARARLADDAERLARVDRVGHAVDGAHDAVVGRELHGEVLDLQQRRHQ